MNTRDRVDRGGSWFDVVATGLAARVCPRNAPSGRDLNLGFRCVTREPSSDRVYRGGCWRIDDATRLAARARFRLSPSFRFDYLGFRCWRNR